MVCSGESMTCTMTEKTTRLSLSSFNGDIGGWNTASVPNMFEMFYDAFDFNQDISGWNTEKVTNMSYTFRAAISFNQDISGWNVEAVTNMEWMFAFTSFNQDISGWDVEAVTNMTFMFAGFNARTPFNQNISGWNTAKVTDMHNIFQNNTSFNGDIGNWNTAQVTNMRGMFADATSFNGDIGNWNTVAVTDMQGMFLRATSFNGDIGNWNTVAVTNMKGMFWGATSFDQNIGRWNVEVVTDMELMLALDTLSPANYDSLLVGWNGQNLTSGVTFHGGASKHSSVALLARDNMINSDGWHIRDGGRVQLGDAPTSIFLSSTSIAENAGTDAVVGTLSTNGGASSYTYALVAGTGDDDNTSFRISGTELQLKASADYETKTSYAVRLKVDGVMPEVAK